LSQPLDIDILPLLVSDNFKFTKEIDMEKLQEIVNNLKFTDTMNQLLSKIVAPDAVSVIPSKSKNGVEGIKIYGIQCFNKAQLMKDEDFSALNDAIKASSNHSLLVRHDDAYETPMVWIGPGSTNNQSKEDKQTLFA
tara:strand:- start:7873 stop:8283 length:411 start_codon:yes stop_codon:yes gene_type:complete